MNARITARITAALLFAASLSAYADHDYRVARNNGAVYDYAKVISSQPIVDYVTVKKPVRECWEEMQTYTIDHGARHSRGGALVGAIIGGAVGHQFGGGRGKDAATAVGTILGAAIGSEKARQRYGVETVSRPVRRCETTFQSHREERIDGYRVTYRYNGQKYMTEMPYDPGRRIRVRVDIRPAG